MLAYIKVIHKVTLSFTPYPLFQWYPQSNEILLNRSMKCWNSAFDAQGSRVIIVVAQVKQQWRCSGKRKEGMKLTLPSKLVGKLVWAPVISFCKISFSVTHLMPYYAKTGHSRPQVAWLYRLYYCICFVSIIYNRNTPSLKDYIAFGDELWKH